MQVVEIVGVCYFTFSSCLHNKYIHPIYMRTVTFSVMRVLTVLGGAGESTSLVVLNQSSWLGVWRQRSVLYRGHLDRTQVTSIQSSRPHLNPDSACCLGGGHALHNSRDTNGETRTLHTEVTFVERLRGFTELGGPTYAPVSSVRLRGFIWYETAN